MTDPVRLLFGSDFHFGIRSVSQEDMAMAFSTTIFPHIPESDIIFINGDFFDTLVIFDNHGFDPVYDTIMNLFKLCDLHKVTLRVLQGTWTHDRNQCKRFEVFYKNGKFTFDFKFIGSIELEEIKIRDRTIKLFYTPDDLPFKSSNEIVEVISGKLVERGWDHVDYGCMHGFFDFTFPSCISQANSIVFTESQFPFVKKLIDVGHVHQHRISGNVISNGSFDRFVFGDESPKGFIKVLDYEDHYTAHFIENTNSAIYDTLVFTSEDTTESIRVKIDSHLKSIKSNRQISIRCVIESLDHKEAIKSWMKEVYPDVRCMIKRSAELSNKNMMTDDSLLDTSSEKRISPTPETLAVFIRNYIPENYPISIDDINRYLHE